MQIKQALNWANKNLESSPSANLDAEILMLEVLNKADRSWLIAHSDRKLSESELKRLKELIVRRKKHEPIAYITGHKEFYGLDFYVDKNTLIPRPETEVLVEETQKEINSNMKIAEIGTGSGCISIALAKNSPSLKIYATDISKTALTVAKLNAKKHKALKQIKFFRGNLLKPIQNKLSKIKIIVANLPYLDEDFSNLLDSSDTKGIRFEPKTAWDGGKNGLEIYQKLFSQIPKDWRGIILIEIGSKQTNPLKKIIKQNFDKSQTKIIKDRSNLPRILKIII